MGYATSINWLFYFLLTFLWPMMSRTDTGGMKPEGAVAFYAFWCVAGWFIVLL
jgi:hypothetical protein